MKSPEESSEEALALAQWVGKELLEADERLMEYLGLDLVAIEPDRAVCTLTVRQEMANSHGICQGGLVFALADHAFGYACMSRNQRGVTLSANVVYHFPARVGDTLTATAQVSVDGRQTASCTVGIVNQKGRPIADFQGVNFRFRRTVVSEEPTSKVG